MNEVTANTKKPKRHKNYDLPLDEALSAEKSKHRETAIALAEAEKEIVVLKDLMMQHRSQLAKIHDNLSVIQIEAF